MKLPLETIQKLLSNLPGRDSRLATKFLERRDFSSILELVNSDIYLVNRNEAREVPLEKYKNVDYIKLVELKSELEEYMGLLEVPDNSDELDNLYYD